MTRPAIFRERTIAWRKANPEAYRRQNLRNANKRKRDNPEVVKSYARSWWAKQAVCKSNAWIAKNMRTRIYLAVKRGQKIGSLSALLGCSIPDLRLHLESKFKPGTSWDNYGQWHVDHIRPCASFDLSKPEEQRACFHYTNLQPLWKVDNLSKNRK